MRRNRTVPGIVSGCRVALAASLAFLAACSGGAGVGDSGPAASHAAGSLMPADASPLQPTVPGASGKASAAPAAALPTPHVTPDSVTRVFAAGDLAWEGADDDQVAEMLDESDPHAFLALGDLVYPDGTLENYERFYEPSFGRFNDVVWPTPGNHDYVAGTLDGYHAYFGTEAPHVPTSPYYAFQLGSWRLYSLNSEVSYSPIAAEMHRWLEGELAEHQSRCMAAYWHRPVETLGPNDSDQGRMADPLELLRAHGVDIILVGHDHNYQRWDLDGLAYFVVGTGGREEYGFTRDDSRVRAASDDVEGALELELQDDGARFRFHALEEGVLDEGVIAC